MANKLYLLASPEVSTLSATAKDSTYGSVFVLQAWVHF